VVAWGSWRDGTANGGREFLAGGSLAKRSY